MIIFPRLNSPERVKTVLYDLENILILFLLFIYDFRVVLKSHLKWSKSSDVTVLNFSSPLQWSILPKNGLSQKVMILPDISFLRYLAG